MAVKKADEKTDDYTKEQLLSSKRYEDKKDAVNVILKEGQFYSIKEADELINKFMERKVN